MKAIILRNIPPDVAKAIRQRAREQRISASRAVLELLQERIEKIAHSDLDDLAGSWSAEEAKAFSSALRKQRRVDGELWG